VSCFVGVGLFVLAVGSVFLLAVSFYMAGKSRGERAAREEIERLRSQMAEIQEGSYP
jgi:hypothetical protein